MPRVALKTGAYQARSIIAMAQRCVNLYAEKNPEDAPVPFTYYPTPGLISLGTPAVAGAGRGLFTASNGNLYSVVGQRVYAVSPTWNHTFLGSLTASATNPVSFADNSVTGVFVDGSNNGYTIQLATNTWGTISDPAFYGSDRVDYMDTFFLFNKPASAIFYISNSNSTTFNALNFASKVGASDLLQVAAVVHREIWLLGGRQAGTGTSEIWTDAGSAAFPFQILDGAFVQHGCEARASVAQMGDALFWLSRDKQGSRVVVKGQGYQAQRISTHAIEVALATYSTCEDAWGQTYQQEGHQFYVLHFPTADKCWAFDLTTEQWHERVSIDANGVEHRPLYGAIAAAYGTIVAQDWATGALYQLDLNTYTDVGAPIVRRRGFPHMISDGRRVTYRQFIADVEVGTDPNTLGRGQNPLGLEPDGVDQWVLNADATTSNLAPDATTLGFVPDGYPNFGSDTVVAAGNTGLSPDPFVPVILALDNGAYVLPAAALCLRYSDTRGASWSDPISDDFGYGGDFYKSIQFQRLGMARDRVFELFWSAPVRTALNGAFIEAKPSGS